MSIPKEPRQIMINLMYLVLTAMLALNISSEILHAFKILNSGITKSNQAVENKNNDIMRDFQANEDMKDQRDTVKPYNDKAKAIRAQTAIVYNYLDNWKTRIINQAGGFKTGKEAGQIKNEENIDASTYLLVEQKKGDSIKTVLNNYRQYLLTNINQNRFKDQYIELSKSLPIETADFAKDEDNPSGDWSTGTFYHVPTLGVIALMSKMQNDVRNAEAATLNELFREAKAKPLTFDAITAIAVPKTSYALVGQEIEAQISIAAYNRSVKPDVYSSTGHVEKVENGIATWKTVAGGIGVQKVTGTVSVINNGQKLSQPWSFEYMVGSAGASLQLDKMNVFYIGVPNPVTVTAAGYSLEDVSLSVPAGVTATPTGKGKYDITVSTVGNIEVGINAKTAKGFAKVSVMPIRVKRIPDPVATCGGKMGGAIRADIFRVQLGIAAELKGFDFDVKCQVVSYEMTYQQKRGDLIGPIRGNGALFGGLAPEGAKYQSTLARPGDRVYLENIKAKLPDGTTRLLNSINFILQ